MLNILKNSIWNLLVLFVLVHCWRPTAAQTTQVKGLTVIVQYTNAPFTNSIDSVSMMMNAVGFNGWGNTGSVRDYYYNQTNGKYLITCEVIKVSLAYPSTAYYGPGATRHDLPDIIAAINQQKPAGFQNLTIDPEDGKLMLFAVLTKAGGGAWAFGQQDGYTMIKNNGVDLQVGDGCITNYGLTENPQRNTICHEMGHCVFGWSDFYNRTENNGSSNLGHYCLMGSGGSQQNGSPIAAPFRYKKGWITTVTEIPNTNTTHTVTSNIRSQVYKYTNPNNPFEYFLIEGLYINGDYQAVDGEGYSFDQGLAVWYVDEEKAGANVGALRNDPRIKLVQADGLDEMHDITINDNNYTEKAGLRGDLSDLFDNQYPTLSAATHPFFRWKDGSEPGLTITNISAAGATMQFTVQARPNTISSQVAYTNGGTISPRGLIPYVNGTSSTFTIQPEIGYQVANVVVDGVSRGAVTSYTINTAGNHTISATFQASTLVDAVPSPWIETEIGNSRKAGTAGHRNGVFGLESNHYDIWGLEDGLSFIYQPITGNGEIVAKITSMNYASEWSKAGIMMRESLTPGSKHFMLARTPGNNLAPQYRDLTNGDSYHNPQGTDIKGDYAKYPWLKIVRQGSTFTSYCSIDGVNNWVQLATYSISMASTIYVGMCASSGTDVLPTKVTFSNVTVIGGNSAPTVSITSPANNATFTAPASFTINATASDAGGSIAKVEFYNGTTKLGEDNSSPYSFNWSSVAAGSYSITAKAFDNSGLSTTSSPVSVQVTSGGSFSVSLEAETQTWSQAVTETSNGGYSGASYVNTNNVSGAWIEFTVNVPSAGTYTCSVRYANATGDRAANVLVNGTTVFTSTPFPVTGAWTTWKTKTFDVVLNSGSNKIRLVATTSNGLANIDKMDVSGGIAPVQYTLTANTSGSGTVAKSPNQSNYASGTVVTLTATPASGFQFTGWSGAASGTANPITVTMDANKTLTATFTAISTNYTLTANTSGSGTVAKSPNQTSYASGTVVTVTATPASGFQFTGWSGAVSGTTNPISVTMDANKTLTATFTAISTTYTLTTNTSGSGTVAKSPNQTSYASGTVVTVTATPSSGYQFTGWSGAASGTANPISVTMDANKTLKATFSQIVTGGDICVEAESALGQSTFSPYQVYNDANASGGKYIMVPNGTGNQSSPPTTSIATLNFNVATAGIYNIWLRCISPTSSDNDMYLSVDASSYSSFTAGPFTSWTWKKWTSKSLSAGTHTLSVARKEDGLQIDKVLLTTTANTPSGMGCINARREEEQDFVKNEDNLSENAEILLAPNPSSGMVRILAIGQDIDNTIQVYNAVGNLVATLSFFENMEAEFNVSDMPAGLYFVKMNQAGKVISKSLLVTK